MEQESPLQTALRLRSCSFTGHRPEKLTLPEAAVRAALAREIDLALEAGCDRFITGMSRGVDLWAGEELLRRRAQGIRLQLIAAVPYVNFGSNWSQEWQDLFQRVLHEAEEIHFFSQGFSYDSFTLRNHFMVDQAQRIIAVYNGGKGGTANTLNYARSQGRLIRLVQDTDQIIMDI